MPSPIHFGHRVLGGGGRSASVGFFSVFVWCLAKWFRLMIKAVKHYGIEVHKVVFVLKCCRNWDAGQPGTALGTFTSLPWRAALSTLGSRILCKQWVVSY